MSKIEAFTFGEPTPVMDRYDLLYTGVWLAGQNYYEPPVDLQALAKSYRATAHHGSALQVKRNILLKCFQPSRFLSRQDFARIALDYLVFGNLYGERVENRFGRLLKLKPLPALYTRRGVEEGVYWWVQSWRD